MPNTLEVSTLIQASPSEVWAVVADLRRMGEFSPQCERMLFRGPLREGTRTLNINRQGAVWWPTSSKVTELVPNERIAFSVLENRMVWSYNLIAEGDDTVVVHRREAPRGTSALSRTLVSRFFGGEEKFERALKRGMTQTLYSIKQAVELGR